MTIPDGNRSAVDNYHDEEARRERIGKRAEEIRNDMVAYALGAAVEIQEAMDDCPRLYGTLSDALAYDDLARFRKKLVEELARRAEDAALSDAEAEDAGI